MFVSMEHIEASSFSFNGIMRGLAVTRDVSAGLYKNYDAPN